MQSIERAKRIGRAACAIAFALALPLFGCTEFNGPPVVTLEGLNEGVLPDVHAPLVLAFSKPVDPSTLKLEIAPFVTDSNGYLVDETDPPGVLVPLYDHTPGHIDDFGTSALSADGQSFTITPTSVLQIGPQFVIIIEPGLASPGSLPTTVRRRIVFSYAFALDCNAKASVLEAGDYFVLVDVTQPVATQVRLFGSIDIDQSTGSLIGQFSKAMRNTDPSRCPGLDCPSTDACQTLPTPMCVIPSTSAASVDDYPDFLPNTAAPLGFTFTATGCTKDQGDNTAAFSTAPVDVMVTQPIATLRNTVLTASLTKDASGVLRGSGTLSADNVLLNGSASGPGTGNLTIRSIPTDKTIPTPPTMGDH